MPMRLYVTWRVPAGVWNSDAWWYMPAAAANLGRLVSVMQRGARAAAGARGLATHLQYQDATAMSTLMIMPPAQPSIANAYGCASILQAAAVRSLQRCRHVPLNNSDCNSAAHAGAQMPLMSTKQPIIQDCVPASAAACRAGGRDAQRAAAAAPSGGCPGGPLCKLIVASVSRQLWEWVVREIDWLSPFSKNDV